MHTNNSRSGQHKPGYKDAIRAKDTNRAVYHKASEKINMLANQKVFSKKKKTTYKDTYLPIAEHLSEQFSVGCETECSSPYLSEASRNACDMGTLQYCLSDINNLKSETCKTFLNDVSINASKENDPKGYFSKWQSSIRGIGEMQLWNRDKLTDDKLIHLFNLYTYDSVMLEKVFHTILEKGISPKDDLWQSLSPQIDNLFTSLVISSFFKELKNKDISTMLDMLGDEKLTYLYQNYDVPFKPITDYILQSIRLDQIIHPSLLAIRSISSSMKNGLDLFVLNQITGDGMTFIPVDNNTGYYKVNIVNRVMLYDPSIRSYFKNIPDTDAMHILIQNADMANKERWITMSDTSSDPVSIAMKATGDPNLAPPEPKKQDTPSATTPAPVFPPSEPTPTYSTSSEQVSSSEPTPRDMSYCFDPMHVGDDVCVGYVNNLQKSESEKNDLFKKILDATFKNTEPTKSNFEGDARYKEILDKYDGLQSWIVENTSDIVSKDSNGRVVITSACGDGRMLSTEQCSNICKAYPDLCEKDVIQKCSLPQYRYEAESFKQEAFASDNNAVVYIIIAFVFFAILVSIIAYRRYSYKPSHSNTIENSELMDSYE